MEEVIKQAVAEAESKNIDGKDVTPFILKRVTEKTDGLSLSSSILYYYVD
jgi:pseudouridine-5'-phosphate glycosidase